MGLQQKMLYISGLIAVGIAILIGIQKFESSSAEANLHALTLDLLTIASKAQQYYHKPRFLEGGGLSFADLATDGRGLERLHSESKNLNGTFQIISATDQSLVVEATGMLDYDEDGKNLTMQITVFADSVQTKVLSY